MGIFVGCPAFAFEPQGVATYRLGREDVFLEAITHNQNFIRLHFKDIDAQLENHRVGLAHSHHCAFNHALEILAQVEVAQHAVDVAVEIAHKHHGVMPAQELERGPGLLD